MAINYGTQVSVSVGDLSIAKARPWRIHSVTIRAGAFAGATADANKYLGLAVFVAHLNNDLNAGQTCNSGPILCAPKATYTLVNPREEDWFPQGYGPTNLVFVLGCMCAPLSKASQGGVLATLHFKVEYGAEDKGIDCPSAYLIASQPYTYPQPLSLETPAVSQASRSEAASPDPWEDVETTGHPWLSEPEQGLSAEMLPPPSPRYHD